MSKHCLLKTSRKTHLSKTIVYIIVEALATVSITAALLVYVQDYLHVPVVNHDGDLSSWTHAIVTSAIGIYVSVVVMTYSIYYEKVANDLAQETKEIALQQKKILQDQEFLRQRRQRYAIYEIKNHFTTLLFTLGLINRLVIEINKKDEKEKIKSTIDENLTNTRHVIEAIRNALSFSNDVIDPTIIDEINAACKLIYDANLKEENGKFSFLYDDMKKRIYEVTEKFPVL
jgi:hypothetical protein